MLGPIGNFIALNEGFRDRGYTDTNGNMTIGFGFMILERDEAQAVLNIKIQKIDQQLRDKYGAAYTALPDGVKTCLVDIVYQMGFGGATHLGCVDLLVHGTVDQAETSARATAYWQQYESRWIRRFKIARGLL